MLVSSRYCSFVAFRWVYRKNAMSIEIPDQKNGGPAFPVGINDGVYLGISVRDYFAAQALQGIIIHASNDRTVSIPNTSNGFSIDRMGFAKTAYQYADAMLLSREL